MRPAPTTRPRAVTDTADTVMDTIMVMLTMVTAMATVRDTGAATAAIDPRAYSTVTLLARLRGWSTSVPLMTAVW